MKLAEIERDKVVQDLQRLIDSANAPIFGIDLKGNVNEWNKQASSITGYSKEDSKDDVWGQGLVANYIFSGYRQAVSELY
jgi:PAS domain S-box-containing protein